MFATTSLIAALVAVTSLSRAPSNEVLSSLSGATTWINARPISAQELRGKVVVVSFWTYTRINWRRTMPYLRVWVQRYKDAGLVLIGVHAPEFEFERDLENVRQAVRDIDIPFPVAVDNEFSVWQAFGNEHWPALYTFDAQGRLRHHQVGENGYDKAERVIRQLLGEARQQSWLYPPDPPAARGAEAPADWNQLQSSENFLGLKRTRGFASPEALLSGERQRYAFPLAMELDEWALSGTWAVRGDRVVSAAAAGKLAYRFHARDLHLVMAPETRGKAIRFRVLIDGKPPGPARGADVDLQGHGTLRDQRMYQLIRQSAPITDRLFEIQFLDPGAAAFCFTFG